MVLTPKILLHPLKILVYFAFQIRQALLTLLGFEVFYVPQQGSLFVGLEYLDN